MSDAIRFIIVKIIGDQNKVVLEYNADLIRTRLQRIAKENMPKSGIFTRADDVEERLMEAVGNAWDELVSEFKTKTITLK